MMKLFFAAAAAAAALGAQPLDLAGALEAAGRTAAAEAQRQSARSEALSKRSEVLPEGFSLNGAIDYTSLKDTDRSEAEYHVSVEKPLRIADVERFEKSLALDAQISGALEVNRLKNRVYGYYVDACVVQEKLLLLEDARSRNVKMTALIEAGIEGGEFDRSALLRSELAVGDLEVRIASLGAQYRRTLKMLEAYTGVDDAVPVCSDLPSRIPDTPADLAEHSLLYRQLENRAASAGALSDYRRSYVPEITLGVGYDDEMDLRRGTFYASIPLGRGARRNNELEAARAGALAAAANLNFMKTAIDKHIVAYSIAQQNRRNNLRRINDDLIPKAYESTVLLEERFRGSEASYLEYIDSQKVLFDLLIRGAELRGTALKARADLFALLGIDPASTDKDNL